MRLLTICVRLLVDCHPITQTDAIRVYQFWELIVVVGTPRGQILAPQVLLDVLNGRGIESFKAGGGVTPARHKTRCSIQTAFKKNLNVEGSVSGFLYPLSPKPPPLSEHPSPSSDSVDNNPFYPHNILSNLNKKLDLNKSTIVNLGKDYMKIVRGGLLSPSEEICTEHQATCHCQTAIYSCPPTYYYIC